MSAEPGPWGLFYDAQMGWAVDGTVPGVVAQMHWLERAERAAEQREAEERAERIEARREAHLAYHLQRALWQGRPGVNPLDPATYCPSVSEMVEEHWRAEDVADRRNLRRQMIDAGLLADLGPRFAQDERPPESTDADPGGPYRSRWRTRIGEILRRSENRPQDSWVPYSQRGRTS